MKFLGMGGFEFVIILVVILIIFGPKNLPKLGNALGKSISNLREGMSAGKKDEAAENVAAAEGDEPAKSASSEKPALQAEIETVEEDAPAEAAAEEASMAEAAVEDAAAEVRKVKKVVKKQ